MTVSCMFLLLNRQTGPYQFCARSHLTNATLKWLGKAHTSTKAKKSPLIKLIQYQLKKYLNLQDSDFLFGSATNCSHSYTPATHIWQIFFIKIHKLFPEKCMKMSNKYISQC